MLNFVIVVNDAGELKTVSATDIWNIVDKPGAPDTAHTGELLDEVLDRVLNYILDQRAIATGTYEPGDDEGNSD